MEECRNCRHPKSAHNWDACRTKIGIGYNHETATFTSYRDCDCPGYCRPFIPEAKTICPHDFQSKSDHPNKCVHCGDVVKRDARTE